MNLPLAACRCLGAKIGKWVRVSCTDVLTVPDALHIEDYAHLGDMGNLTPAAPLSARDILVAPIIMKANVRLGLTGF